MDKLEKGNNLNGSTLMSKGVSPIRNSGRNAPPSASGRKKSLSKLNSSFDTKENAV